MKTIWKYILNPKNNIIEMPEGSTILCADSQLDEVCIWVEVNPKNKLVERELLVVGTGHEIKNNNVKYIGTAKIMQETIILHVFEFCK